MLQIDQLSKKFVMHIRSDAQIEGFDGISFQSRAGELVAVTGPSGSGKSSLLKCIYRTYTPTGGHARYRCQDGSTVDLATAEPWEIIHLRSCEIGYVSQFFSVIPRVSAIDILTQTQTARGAAAGVARDRAAEYLEKVGIGTKVRILDTETNEEETYQIFGSMESDVANNIISNESPVGQALLGKSVGEEVIVEAPGGEIKLVVLEISKADGND